MIVLGAVALLVALALVTQIGVLLIQRSYRPVGQMIDVAGARLHVVDIGPHDGAAAKGPPLVLIHGASANLEAMRQPLGDLLAANHRVILIDRPGHGFSTREQYSDSTPAIQAAMINQALGRLGVKRAIIVVHSLAGALGAAMALNHPSRVAGLVMLAPVTHPWPGGVAWYNELTVTPLLGWLFTHTISLPVGLALSDSGAKSVFLPQEMPHNYVRDTGVPLLMRPSEFTANAHDLVTLKASVIAQVRRYGEIGAPVVVIAGDKDTTVSTDIHARQFVAAVKHAKLIVLPGVGHMPQNAAPEVVQAAVDDMIAGMAPLPLAAVH